MASPALAHVCTNGCRQPGAGVAAHPTFDVDTGTFDIDWATARLTPTGQLAGGFIRVTVLLGGSPVAAFETFAHVTLDQAFDAGPGDDQCDGVGIDSAEACVIEMLAGERPPPEGL